MRRLAKAGFKAEFVRPALLPDWWDESCNDRVELLPELEVRVARFLGQPLEAVRNPAAALHAPTYPNAQLRKVQNIDRDQLGAAIHSGLRIAAAAVRSLRDPQPVEQSLPTEGSGWRELIRPVNGMITLDLILDDLWRRGILVVPIDILPPPRFQGAACIVEGRPVILVGHRHDEPARVAFFVAHEAGHIAAGDCAQDTPVVDEDEGTADESDMEVAADRYAIRTLIGNQQIPLIDGNNYKAIATNAAAAAKAVGVDAGALIFAWASKSRDYLNASMAVRALYKHIGARRSLLAHFNRHVDVDGASESDRALLQCVFGIPRTHDAHR